MSNLSTQPLDCILLPGLHGTNELYSGLIQALEKHSAENDFPVNCQALSYPTNIKQSYRSLTEWVKQEIDLENTATTKVIIAESFSAPIALRLAHAFPEKISAVIIASGFCNSPVNMTLALLPLRPLFIISPPRAALKHFLLGEGATKESLNELRAILNSIPAKVLSRRLRSVLTLEEASLPAIPDTPVLLLQAQNDGLIPWDIQNQLESHLPHSVNHWIEAPHLLFQSSPNQSAKCIIDFLSNLS